MKTKKILSIILVILLLINAVVLSVGAKDADISQTGDTEIQVTSYQQLKNYLYNSPNWERYVLQNDIFVDDNTNDNTLIVGSFTRCSIDLNGYTLSRSTRGIDSCLIYVNDGAQLEIYDSSSSKTGRMIFRSGNYAGRSSVMMINGDVDICGGAFEILTPYEVGGGVVFLVEQGNLDIYDGVFDSHEAYGGDTIELRHNAYMYDVPHCNIYGGTFYGKYSNFEVSSYSNFTKFGCFYPTVYVYDGEFYIANPDDEYAGFAYCNNGWGQVIVAGGTIFYKCLNSNDEKFIDGISKNLISVEYEGKTGAYYEVTPPTMIGNDALDMVDRLSFKFAKKELSYYSKTGTVYNQNQEVFDTVMNYVDTLEVPAAQEHSPLIWIDNNDSVKTISWYFSDEAHFNGENTVWSELADYRGRVNPFRFNFRPEEDTILYFRALITLDDETQIEDVVKVHYEKMKLNPPITSVSVIDVTEPVAGKSPDFSFATGSRAYYINYVHWKDIDKPLDSLKETDVFEAGHTYELEVWLRTSENYKFKIDSDDFIDITATIGGKQAEVIPPGAENTAIISITYTVADEEIMLGDVDGDSKITIMDATAIQRYIAKDITLDAQQLLAADTDKNSKVSIMDATLIQRFVAKQITEF